MTENSILAKSSTPRQINMTKKIIKIIRENWQLYLLALPAVAFLFAFSYMPMFGVIIAFKDFNLTDGIFGSKFMEPVYYNFKILFDNESAFTAMKNTIVLNLLFIASGTIFALILALLFNEIRNKAFKRITQSLTFLPHFISWVVVGLFMSGLLNYDNGSVNHLLANLGLDRVQFFQEPAYWPFILATVAIWKGAGYHSVVYLATIAGIDETYYEAAQIDGATRWQQMWYISLPLLKPTVVILTLLAIGRIMNADFGMFYNVTQDIPTLYPVTDVIDTFIFRCLRQTGDIGISSAAAFFQSVVACIMFLIFNRLANIVDKDAAIF